MINLSMNRQTAIVAFLDKPDSTEPSISEAEAINVNRITICYSRRLNASVNRTKSWLDNRVWRNSKLKWTKGTESDSYRLNAKRMWISIGRKGLISSGSRSRSRLLINFLCKKRKCNGFLISKKQRKIYYNK